MMYKVINTNKEDIDLYNGNFMFNEYNSVSKKEIDLIKELLSKDYFEVPYYVKKTRWGEETVFYPFTNKLFKIVHTINNDTSVQLHPIKNETWYPLEKATIFNGKNWVEVNKNQVVSIPSHSVHCMRKGSRVFEVQDNNIIDDTETIRIFDINGRLIEKKDEYINYVLPHLKNKLTIKKFSSNKIQDNNIFLFVVDGVNKIGEDLLEENKLYYIKKNKIKDLIIQGKVIIIKALYYKMEKIDELG